MHNNIPYYNAISREAMVKRIMEYAGESYSFESFKALDKEALPSVSTKGGELMSGEDSGNAGSQFRCLRGIWVTSLHSRKVIFKQFAKQ